MAEIDADGSGDVDFDGACLRPMSDQKSVESNIGTA